MTETTKTRAPRKSAAAKAETVTEFETFEALPRRSYTMSKPPAHADFFNAVRKANEGKTGDERVFLKFPAASKGVSAAIKNGVYAAIEKGEFDAANRTVDGTLQVFVTVADKA